MGLKVLSLFSGVGAFEEALKNLEIDFELVNYCEFQEDIAKAYSLIHNVPIEKNLGDITQVDEKKLEDFDLMTYGYPCQDISSLGSQKGFFNEDGELTRSGLFFEAMRIAKEKKPKYMIAENVRALTHKPMIENFNHMIELIDELGYNSYWKILNSKDYGIPQSRNRIFIVSIRKDIDNKEFDFPDTIPLTVKAKDFYDKGKVGKEYYLPKELTGPYNEMRLKKKYSSINADILICMTTKQGRKTNPQNFVKDKKGIRLLTERELMALQGFKKEYGDTLKDNDFSLVKIGYMLGNSITVNVLEGVLSKLLSEEISKNN